MARVRRKKATTIKEENISSAGGGEVIHDNSITVKEEELEDNGDAGKASYGNTYSPGLQENTPEDEDDDAFDIIMDSECSNVSVKMEKVKEEIAASNKEEEETASSIKKEKKPGYAYILEPGNTSPSGSFIADEEADPIFISANEEDIDEKHIFTKEEEIFEDMYGDAEEDPLGNALEDDSNFCNIFADNSAVSEEEIIKHSSVSETAMSSLGEKDDPMNKLPSGNDAGSSKTISATSKMNKESVDTNHSKVGRESCIIEDLLKHPFLKRSKNEKTKIVEEGRPCPQLEGLTKKHQDKNKQYLRKFSPVQYQSTHWLTGSAKLNKLFCWPCLLFSDEINVWSRNGFDNLSILTVSVSRHEKIKSHIFSFMELNRMQGTRLVEQHGVSDASHNGKVRKNREILLRLIDATCILIKQGLPIHSTSIKKGNGVALLEQLCQPVLKIYMKKSNIFGDLHVIQDDLLSVMNEVMTNEIKEELAQARFVSLILHKTSDMMVKPQVCTVVRYVDKNCDIQERFLNFTDVNSDPSSIERYINTVLSSMLSNGKLLSYSYDGSVVTAYGQRSLNEKINRNHPQAMFVPCFSQVLNLTLHESCKEIRECGVFFQTLSCLREFLSRSSERTSAFQSFLRTIKKKPPEKWTYFLKFVETVYDYYVPLIAYFHNILDHSSEWADDNVLKAQGFLAFLEKPQTRFLVHLFSTLFTFTTDLYHSVQNKLGLDMTACDEKVKSVIKSIESIRENDFDKIFQESVMQRGDENPTKKLRFDKTEYKSLFIDIVNNVLLQLKVRFENLPKLKFFSLLDCDNFEKNLAFLDEAVSYLEGRYFDCFDVNRLKNELQVLYCSEDFKDLTPCGILQVFKERSLYEGMPETFKLATIIATIPATFATGWFNTGPSVAYKRIHTYLQNTQGKKAPPALALLSIEKDLLGKMRKKNGFYNEVIKQFSKKTQREEFIFR